MSGAWPGHAKDSPAYRKILLALLFAGLATFAQLYSLQGVLTGVASEFGVSPADAALSVSAATLGLALAVIPWSAVADRVGRRRTMTWAIAAAVVLGFLAALAPTFELLIVLRFLEGTALGGVPATALVYLHEEVQKLHAAVAAGTYIAGTTLGGLAGRLVAGPVGELLGWRAGVLAVSVMAGAAAIAFILLSPRPRGFLPVLHGQGPSLASRIGANLRSPRLLVVYAQGFLLMGGFVAVYNYLGFRLEAPPFLLPASLVSLLFLAYLSGTVTSRLAGDLSGRFGRLPVLLAAVPVILAGLAITLTGWLPLVVVGLVIFTGGFFAAHSVASGWTSVLATTGRAQASGLYNFAYYAGSSSLGWVGGLFFGHYGWIGVAGFTSALAITAGLLAVLVLRGAPGASGRTTR
ncbi:MAG: transporter [Micrococcaceae bacterium]|uniref:MFS transporter n=1 Tax=Arthrobacter cheniae TaxID=1258888 RepID=A0A3A5MJA1_9MICC|nr:MFS transporter [Arthrobacter cheniae]MCU1632915.1 transporter [Micrococcaceae bacterium]RJT83294.1 MFS transporter [Arthrobacter cheniae]